MTRAGLTRPAVLEMAAVLADERGLRAATLSAVARELGVRTPSLYSHVRGTDDLRAGLAELALTDLADRGDRALAGRSGRRALAAWANVHRDYAREHPGRFAAAGTLDVAPTPTLEEAAARVAAQSLAVLRGYPVPEADRVHAVRLMASLLRGFVELEAGGAFGGRGPTSEESWARALAVLDESLTRWPHAALTAS
ncbi:TetR/AcrR family transcriptional regulator [Nocardioides sp.]|uniref:TetR/AcrR family transcriptional regulator n=1 Tax=Nocardioides sp. TaxID=35761 RepID=UPI002ED92D28